jgi:hypothetical protein
MEKEKLIDNLIKKYPFIYHTQSLGYVYIGCQVFRKCTDEEIGKYTLLRKELDEFIKWSKCSRPSEKRMKNFKELFAEIRRLGDVEYDEIEAKRVEYEIRNNIKQLSAEEVNELSKQVEKFIKACDYNENVFYR